MCCIFYSKKLLILCHIASVLINKLKLLDILTPLLYWLFSYLHGKFPSVVLEGKTSSCVRVVSAVIQGSVSGALRYSA